MHYTSDEDDSSTDEHEEDRDDVDDANQNVEDSDSHPFQNLFQFLEDKSSNEVVSANLVVSKAEMLLAMLKFSSHYSLPNAAAIDMCKMLNNFFDEPVVPETQYKIDQLFYPVDGTRYFGICPTCKEFVKEFTKKDRKIKCLACDLEINVKDPLYHDYFVILDIRDDIVKLLESNDDYYDEVVSGIQNRPNEEFNDIYDGLLYKAFVASLPDDRKKSYVTGILNFDGKPIFRNSKFSVWPGFLNLNELPIDVRYKKPVTCVLWFGHDKPNMEIVLHHFVESMNVLTDTGIPVKIQGRMRDIHPYIPCSCVDSVARASMQCMSLFNGSYGCHWCLHHGEMVLHKTTKVMKYPLLKEVPMRRTEQDTIQHMEQSQASGRVLFGMKKPTPLRNLKAFNIIDGFVPDPLHCVNLGCTKQFTNYFFNTTGNPYSITKRQTNALDQVQKSFKVPSILAKLARSLLDRGFWSGREWENWLLHYSIPILKELPDFECYFEHWIHLVEALHILMQNRITLTELRTADRLLKEFVARTELHYGKDAMTYNVHQLTHLAQSVADWGPLWAHAGYPFESAIGKLAKKVHASNGVINQLCRSLSIDKGVDILFKHVAAMEESPIIRFCNYLDTKHTKRTFKVGPHRYFGKEFPPEQRIVDELSLSNSETRAYEKLIKDRCLYKSCNKTNVRSSNSYAQTTAGKFIQINQFLIDTENQEEHTVCKEVKVENIVPDICTKIKQIVGIEDEVSVIETSSIEKLCVNMSVNEKGYTSTIPNIHWYS